MRKKLFALVDVNNFYAASEKAFEPRLRHRPVIVMSNNDSAVVARSKEAKALGIKMGVPWFQIREWAEQQGVVAMSSNYELYADMSTRVVEVLRDFCPHLEPYSVDESFLALESLHPALLGDHTAYGQKIKQRLAQWLGMPVCVGFGPSKTLAKFANHLAKKNDCFEGVCDLLAMTPEQLDGWMERIEVGEVWGVGPRNGKRLQAMGIQTVLDLKHADATLIRREFSVVLQRTVMELRGVSCLALEEVAPAKQQIMCSRSFGEPVHTLDEMREAVSTYCAQAAEKLRRQGLVAGGLMVGIHTNWHRQDLPQHHRSVLAPVPVATADTRVLCDQALQLLQRIFRVGYAYKKAAVMLTNLSPAQQSQAGLWVEEAEVSSNASRLMAALDAVNARFGRGTIKVASMGQHNAWAMRRESLSPRYTTNWAELPPVKA